MWWIRVPFATNFKDLSQHVFVLWLKNFQHEWWLFKFFFNAHCLLRLNFLGSIIRDYLFPIFFTRFFSKRVITNQIIPLFGDSENFLLLPTFSNFSCLKKGRMCKVLANVLGHYKLNFYNFSHPHDSFNVERNKCSHSKMVRSLGTYRYVACLKKSWIVHAWNIEFDNFEFLTGNMPWLHWTRKNLRWWFFEHIFDAFLSETKIKLACK